MLLLKFLTNRFKSIGCETFHESGNAIFRFYKNGILHICSDGPVSVWKKQ